MKETTLATKRKPRRTSVNGARNVLTVQGKEPGFEYRVVNDDGDRISQFEEMGYEVVTDTNVKVGDRRVANPTKEGSPGQISVGSGTKAYVMRIKKEWYDEAQADKADYIKKTEQGMIRKAKEESGYGSLTIGTS